MPLFRIEKDRFELALREAEAQAQSTKAAAELTRIDFERYQLLASREAASLKERQHAESQMHQADAAHQSALVALDLAKLNLDRTIVRAPTSGKITNFALRAGNYVSAGNAVGVLVERNAIYVAAYFEETKLPRIHVGDRVKINLMTALEVGAAGNLQAIPYSAQLVFTQGGTLSVQAMNPDANAADTPYTTKGYEAYYGPVEIDDAKNIFAITVESSLVRDLIGQRLERKFEVTGDKLVISPVDAAEGWRVSYDRF